MIKCQVKTRIPTKEGLMQLWYYDHEGQEHLVLSHGNWTSASLDLPSSCTNNDSDLPLVRLHSSCITSETFGSLRCDCADQLDESIKRICQVSRGCIIYLNQEGRGIGLLEKLKYFLKANLISRAYNLIDRGHDTLSANLALGHPPDARDYAVAADILKDFNVSAVRLLTNNPQKIQGLQENGIQVVERVPLIPPSFTYPTTPQSSRSLSPQKLSERDQYLVVKAQRMGHLLDVTDCCSTMNSKKRRQSFS